MKKKEFGVGVFSTQYSQLPRRLSFQRLVPPRIPREGGWSGGYGSILSGSTA